MWPWTCGCYRQVVTWMLKSHLKSELKSELKSKVEIESWNRKLKSKVEIGREIDSTFNAQLWNVQRECKGGGEISKPFGKYSLLVRRGWRKRVEKKENPKTCSLPPLREGGDFTRWEKLLPLNALLPPPELLPWGDLFWGEPRRGSIPWWGSSYPTPLVASGGWKIKSQTPPSHEIL